MDYNSLIKQASHETGFKPEKCIYQADYYGEGDLRNKIYRGKLNGQSAVLKIYSDKRICFEPLSLIAFNKFNKSKKLIAPKLYKHKIISPHCGWFIMEDLGQANFLKSPLDKNGRNKFLELYLEYRRNFPIKPFRKAMLAENLRADNVHILRLMRWFNLANDAEEARILKGKMPLLGKDFILKFEKALELIKKEFRGRKLVWCHGHFKPKEIFYSQEKEIYYLTDFAHTHYFPEGYELAFMVWADWLMAGDWKLPYSRWKKGIDDWLSDLEPIAKKLKIKDFRKLMKASLLERVLGAILADVVASDKPEAEKKKRLALFNQFLSDLIG